MKETVLISGVNQKFKKELKKVDMKRIHIYQIQNVLID